MESALYEKVSMELEGLESIYADEGVVEAGVTVCEKDPNTVTCTLKLIPNTGFKAQKIAVVIVARFFFPEKVSSN
jgi:hypothetical protein